MRAVDAALVGEVRRPARLGEHRCVELDADQRPGAAGDVGEPGRVGRDPHDGRGGVVRADGDHRGRAPAAPSCRRGRRQQRRRARLPGADDAGQQAGRQPERAATRSTDQSPVRDVEQPGGRGVGDLAARTAGQPVAEQVRDQQQRSRPLSSARRRLGGELVERVERQVLQPVGRVELAARRDRARARRRSPPSVRGVPVVHAGCRAGRRAGRAARSRLPRRRSPIAASRPPAAQASRGRRRPGEDVRRTGRGRPSAGRVGRSADRAVGEPVHLGQARARPGPTRPSMTRPLEAPRSTATTVTVSGHAASAQEGGGDAGVDRDVQAGGLRRARRR